MLSSTDIPITLGPNAAFLNALLRCESFQLPSAFFEVFLVTLHIHCFKKMNAVSAAQQASPVCVLSNVHELIGHV